MKIKYIILSLFALLTLYSCEDFFDSVTEVDVRPQESRLVVFGFFNPKLEEQSVSVRKSKPLYQNNNTQDTVKNVALNLYKNGTLIETCNTISYTGNEATKRYLFTTDLDATPSDVFKLEVSADGMETVSGVSSLPHKAQITNAQKTGSVYSAEYEQEGQGIRITIKDDANIKNYYAFSLLLVDTLTNNTHHLETLSNNPILKSWRYKELLVSDETFNGKTFDADIITFNETNSPRYKIYAQVESMTEDMYRYKKTLQNYENTEDNPFAEPVNIHTNMKEKGFGIFSWTQKERFLLQ